MLIPKWARCWARLGSSTISSSSYENTSSRHNQTKIYKHTNTYVYHCSSRRMVNRWMFTILRKSKIPHVHVQSNTELDLETFLTDPQRSLKTLVRDPSWDSWLKILKESSKILEDPCQDPLQDPSWDSWRSWKDPQTSVKILVKILAKILKNPQRSLKTLERSLKEPQWQVSHAKALPPKTDRRLCGWEWAESKSNVNYKIPRLC